MPPPLAAHRSPLPARCSCSPPAVGLSPASHLAFPSFCHRPHSRPRTLPSLICLGSRSLLAPVSYTFFEPPTTMSAVNHSRPHAATPSPPPPSSAPDTHLPPVPVRKRRRSSVTEDAPCTPTRTSLLVSPTPLIDLDTPPIGKHTPKRRVSLLLSIHFNGSTRPADTFRRGSRGNTPSPL